MAMNFQVDYNGSTFTPPNPYITTYIQVKNGSSKVNLTDGQSITLHCNGLVPSNNIEVAWKEFYCKDHVMVDDMTISANTTPYPFWYYSTNRSSYSTYYSVDNGVTWSNVSYSVRSLYQFAQFSSSDANRKCLGFTNLGSSNNLYYSNGITGFQTLSDTQQIDCIASNGNKIIAHCSAGYVHIYSQDGTYTTGTTISSSEKLRSMVYTGSRFVAVGYTSSGSITGAGVSYISTDVGQTWTLSSLGSGQRYPWRAVYSPSRGGVICFSNNSTYNPPTYFLADGSNTWTSLGSGSASYAQGAVAASSSYIIRAGNGCLEYLNDSNIWTSCYTTGYTGTWTNALAYGNGYFMAILQTGSSSYSVVRGTTPFDLTQVSTISSSYTPTGLVQVDN